MSANVEMLVDPETRMFLGTLDDSVSRYPWQGVVPSISYLNRLLIFHGLLGPQLACRMGNILFYPGYRAALLDPNVSPLLEMCRAGFFQIQMNGDSFNQSIENRRKSGTTSALKFISDTGWHPGGELYNRLDEIQSELVYGKGYIRYRPDFNEHFRNNLHAIGGAETGTFRRIYERWRVLPVPRQTRTSFENMGIELFQEQPAALMRAMRIANSANHYAYGRSLGEVSNVLLETAEVPIFDWMTSTLFGEEERVMQIDRYLQLVRGRVLDTISENLVVPKVLVFRAEAWNDFARMFRVDDPRHDRMISFKNGLIIRINALMNAEEGEPQNIAREDLADHCRKYSDFISRSLGLTSARDYVPVWLKLSLHKLARTAGKIAGAAAGAGMYDATGSGAAVVVVKKAFEITFDQVPDAITRYIDSQRVAEMELSRERIAVAEVGRSFSYPSIKVMQRQFPPAPALH